MKAIEFPEVNVRIAEHQEEYETLPVHIDRKEPTIPTTMCIQLDPEEIKQVAETGRIWMQVLTFGQPFHPIMMSFLKPEGFTEPPVMRRYYIYHDDKGFFVCYKSKSQMKSRGRLVGEFIGIPTQKEVSEHPDEFEPGTIGTLFNGERVEVVETLWFER